MNINKFYNSRFYFYISTICFLFLTIPLAFSSSAKAPKDECKASSSMESPFPDSVEEGWRYKRTMHLSLFESGVERSCNFGSSESVGLDLISIHGTMATILEGGDDSAKDFKINEKVRVLFRFSPVILNKDGTYRLGDPICLPSDLSKWFVESKDQSAKEDLSKTFLSMPRNMPYQEMVFVSGFCDLVSKTPLGKSMTPLTSTSIYASQIDSKIYGMMPPFNPEKPESRSCFNTSVRFLQREYISPSVFERNITFRYSPEMLKFSILNRPIQNKWAGFVFLSAQKSLEERKEAYKKVFGEAEKLANKYDINTYLRNLASLNLESKRQNFHSLPAANSFTCAEQLGLDFIADQSVMKYLQYNLGVEQEQVKGIIVHVHSTHTPCISCATSLARESEAGGLLFTLSNRKPIKVVVTSTQHYKRPETMPNYSATQLKAAEKDDLIVFDLTKNENNLPYPITLLTLDSSGQFVIDNQLHDHLSEAQKS